MQRRCQLDLRGNEGGNPRREKGSVLAPSILQRFRGGLSHSAAQPFVRIIYRVELTEQLKRLILPLLDLGNGIPQIDTRLFGAQLLSDGPDQMSVRMRLSGEELV